MRNDVVVVVARETCVYSHHFFSLRFNGRTFQLADEDRIRRCNCSVGCSNSEHTAAAAAAAALRKQQQQQQLRWREALRASTATADASSDKRCRPMHVISSAIKISTSSGPVRVCPRGVKLALKHERAFECKSMDGVGPFRGTARSATAPPRIETAAVLRPHTRTSDGLQYNVEAPVNGNFETPAI